MKSPSKKRLERRSKLACEIDTALQRIYKTAFGLPSFTGKAAFIDRMKLIQTKAHNLAFDLKADAAEEA